MYLFQIYGIKSLIAQGRLSITIPSKLKSEIPLLKNKFKNILGKVASN